MCGEFGEKIFNSNFKSHNVNQVDRQNSVVKLILPFVANERIIIMKRRRFSDIVKA